MTPPEQPTTATGAARRVVLVRRASTDDTHTSEPDTVHLAALPLSAAGNANGVSALCGMRLPATEIETVAPGVGTWCTSCFVAHVTGNPPVPAANTDAGRLAAGVTYRGLGWPVVLRGDQLSLNLDLDVDAVALAIPALLAAEVTEILRHRHCPPAVLAQPALPAHRIILAGERYPVPVPWPTAVHRITGTVLLPPSVTAHGTVLWVHPPQPHSLRWCREFDVIAALHTALTAP